MKIEMLSVFYAKGLFGAFLLALSHTRFFKILNFLL